MRMLSEFFPEFAEKLDELDTIYADQRSIDEKTYQMSEDRGHNSESNDR